jgi:hypothetical protein
VRALSVLALLTLPLCARAPNVLAPAPTFQLDCSLSFEAQLRRLAGRQLTPAPQNPAEPFRLYSSPDGLVSFLITKSGAPGHPAIIMQRAEGSEVKTTGCPYGGKLGYPRLLAYLDTLKAWRGR